MTPDQIKAYCQAEIAKLDAQERALTHEIEARSRTLIDDINKIRGGRQAYQDIIAELEKPAGWTLDDPEFGRMDTTARLVE